MRSANGSRVRGGSEKRALRTRTAVLVTLVAAAAAWLMAESWPGAVPQAFWFWLLACLAGELMWVRLPLGTGSTLSMASCFNLAALLVLSRGDALLATTIGTVLGERLGLRKPMIRVVYNTSHTAFAVAAGSWMFDLASGGNRDLVGLLSRMQFVPFIAAAVAYYAVNRAAVVTAIASCEGVSLSNAWKKNFGSGYEVLSAGAVLSLGMLFAAHFQGIGMAGTVLVALPLLMACDGLNRFNRVAGSGSQEDEEERRAA